jgi:UDP-N-acetylglucosamine 2-epimerase (non-hydrolysing)
VGTSVGRIVEESERLIRDPAHYRLMAEARNPYGDGQAAGRIVDILDRDLNPDGGTL